MGDGKPRLPEWLTRLRTPWPRLLAWLQRLQGFETETAENEIRRIIEQDDWEIMELSLRTE